VIHSSSPSSHPHRQRAGNTAFAPSRAAEGVAHLIRNAIMPIALRLDLLERDASPSRAGENIRRIRQHIADLQRLASSLERSMFGVGDEDDAATARALNSQPGTEDHDRVSDQLGSLAPAAAPVEQDLPVGGSHQQTIAVLCFDDNVMLTEALGLRLSLEPDIEWLAPRMTLTDAVAEIAATRPDVVLLDLNIPGTIAALDLVRELRKQRSSARVIMLTGNPTAATVAAACAAGVAGFLGKSAAPTVLIDALRRVAAGDTVIAPDA